MKKIRWTKKRILCLLLAAGMNLMLCGCSLAEVPYVTDVLERFGMGTEEETETELREGQRKAKITVVSITGNELTYYEEPEDETETEDETDPATEIETDPAAENGADSELVPESAAKTGTNPELVTETDTEMTSAADATAEQDAAVQGGGRRGMSRMSGEMPDMSRMSSEMPDMSQMTGGFGNRRGTENETETVTVYLPVSVKVHTGKDTAATFSILEAGDELTVLFETNEAGEEIITEIWMEGVSK